jgi:hypothetical protein
VPNGIATLEKSSRETLASKASARGPINERIEEALVTSTSEACSPSRT